uniref:RING-type E3 ubiquitin transferase n=1 Tax=Quercus lobata TaxID=97700 RepID=A0A7N2R7R7_QUELO
MNSGVKWWSLLRSFDTEPSQSQPDDILFLCSLGGGNITRVIRRRLSIHELLLQDDGHCLSSLLMDMNVSVETQERVLQEISEVVRLAGTSPISIGVTFYESDGYDNDDEVVNTIMRDHEGKLIRATKSSIEALEKVTLQQDELDSVATCVICTQEFEAGLEVTRMPCSHVYHEECIVKWLKRSNVCPLCRYSMPHRL